QHCAEKTKFQTKMEKVLQENDRLLTQELSVEIVNMVVHDYVNVDCLNVDACAYCVTTESKLKPDFIKKECYETLLQQYHILETHCISLEVNNQLNMEIFQRDIVSSPESAPTFAELFEINNLKAQITKSEKRTVATSPSANIDSNTHVLSSTGVTLVSSASESMSQDNTKKNRIRRTQKKAKKTELEDHLRIVKSSLNKASVVDSKATSSVIKSVSNVNSNLKCASCNGCTATIVPPREPIPIVNSMDKPVVTLHMTGDRSQLINFGQKFLGTVKFGNDHVTKIMGYGDYQIRNVIISRVYYVEGLGHNLFSVRQFYDSDLEVAFRQHTFFIRNLDGVDLLTGSRGNNLYTLSLQDMLAYSPICLLSKASKTKSCLWHQAVATACFTQNQSIIRLRHGKTPYELLHRKLPDLSFFHVFGALCYPTNDNENLEAVATACFTQNRSIIRLRHGKTPYELMHGKQPDLSFFHVFGALCYPTNDSENVDKLQPKADIGIFIGYAPTKKVFRIYNRCTRRIVESIHVDFDELTAMASEQSSSGPALQKMTPGTISSGLVQKSSYSTSYVPPSRNDLGFAVSIVV
nr:integrase, catalytic region, zinc finger, CCHC-type, peptidase aspartic, catalytic [Tanacetum cinerariifolium]